jgi:hypothetical protein
VCGNIGKTHIIVGARNVKKDTLTLEEREVAKSLVGQRFTYPRVRDVQCINKMTYDRHHGTEGRYLCNEDR